MTWLRAGLKAAMKLPLLVEFMAFFGKELVVANVRLAHDILTPRFYMTPGIVRIPLETRADTEIVLLANLLTLTPGTLTIEVPPSKEHLYVHVMYLDDIDVFRRHVKTQYERRVMELLR